MRDNDFPLLLQLGVSEIPLCIFQGRATALQLFPTTRYRMPQRVQRKDRRRDTGDIDAFAIRIDPCRR